VKAGTPVFELDSPEWHRLRKKLHESQAAIERVMAELAVAERSKTEAETVAKAVEQRVQALASAEVRRGELETELATRRAAIPQAPVPADDRPRRAPRRMRQLDRDAVSIARADPGPEPDSPAVHRPVAAVVRFAR
jgi:seryl-tRNA synthetase